MKFDNSFFTKETTHTAHSLPTQAGFVVAGQELFGSGKGLINFW